MPSSADMRPSLHREESSATARGAAESVGVEERHGFAGALRALGGLGGHVGAPHVKLVKLLRGGSATTPEEVVMTDELYARFDEELRCAGLELSGRDYELLYAMWVEHLPLREALRAAVPAMDEEPWA